MEAVGRLAGGVAHDFNNLLTVILGHCGLALDSLPEDSPLARRIAEIQNEGERASRLTRQLLAFGRRQVMEPRVLNLASVLTGMRQMIRSTVPEHIDTRIVAAERLGHTLLDQGQIEQVILNLVLNARDAMPEGGKLTIELANLELDEARARLHEAPAGRYVMLAVTDTGFGMSEEIRAHIFEPFFTTKSKEKGSGLGLAMVYGIVRQSGGYISCYSEVRAGTTFRILLPRVDSEVEPEAPVAAAQTTGTETVLLVEDDPGVLKLTREVLANAGYTLLSAENPEQAEAEVRRHGGRVELLVTDVILAVGSGREVAQRIAGLQPDIRVLYVSGHTAHAIDHQGVLQPGAWFLQKPFTPRDLLLKVRQVLDLERPVAE
jgi:two-component system, cell cycle sensor histidine kinase and response regulator CckA